MESIDSEKNTATFVGVILALLIFIMAARTALDSDTWWHLRAGEWMLENRQPLLSDMFSFTRFGTSWINHSWLSEVILALLFRTLGHLGLSLFTALLATAALMVIYTCMPGKPLLRAFLMLLGVLNTAVIWSARPQLFSMLLLAWTLRILYLHRWKGINRLWLLPLIFILWSNLHGGFPLGFLLSGCFLLGEILNHLLGIFSKEERLQWKEIVKVTSWAVVGWLVLPLNPNGFNIWRIPFQTVGVEALQNLIQEWASPNFHDLAQQPMLWLFFLLVACFALYRKPIGGSDIISVLGFAYLAFLSRRNMAPLALVTLPILSRYCSQIADDWRETIFLPWIKSKKWNFSFPKSASSVSTANRVINLSFTFLLGLAAVGKLYYVSFPPWVEKNESVLFPAPAVNWIAQRYPQSRIFSEYEWGGYLTWKLPKCQVFIDGRTDLYGDEIIDEWLSVLEGRPGWEHTLSKYHVDLILLYNDRSILKDFEKAGWQHVYADDKAVIYASP